MASGRFVAYYRVSTTRQEESGLGLEAQSKAVDDYLPTTHKLINKFTETESGAKDDRPQLHAAIRECRKHKATLIIAKLDRLARSVKVTDELLRSGVEFIAVDNPNANKLTIHILAAVAEHERDMISSRTKAALAVAKARGTKLGNPVNLDVARANSTRVRTERAAQFADNTYPVIQQIKDAGISSMRGIGDALNARGIKSSRGGDWGPSAVKRVMDRAG